MLYLACYSTAHSIAILALAIAYTSTIRLVVIAVALLQILLKAALVALIPYVPVVDHKDVEIVVDSVTISTKR